MKTLESTKKVEQVVINEIERQLEVLDLDNLTQDEYNNLVEFIENLKEHLDAIMMDAHVNEESEDNN